jgi:hypothetical protein
MPLLKTANDWESTSGSGDSPTNARQESSSALS